MWFETQNCAMMGVQVTASKRKLETAATAGNDICPAKAGRWEPAGTEDCIARLQAVAVPSDAWRPTPVPTPPPPTTPTPTTTATFLSADEFDEDDEFEDELSDDDRCSVAPPTDAIRYQSLTYEYQHPLHHHQHHHQSPTPPPQPQQQSNAQTQQHQVRSSYTGTWQYYAPPATQQTIRCEENGKSYLELGAAPTPIATATTTRVRCCDGRTRWCNVPCYRQRRLAVLNLSMCKLARYRQCSDPSLRRSVLICNTLRHIEREMEAEGQQPCPPHHPPPPEPCYTPPPASSFTECSPQQPQSQHTTSSGTHQVLSGRPAPVVPVSPAQLDPYEHSLREFASPSGRATPFPVASTDADSGIGDDDAGRTINWGSVLSLTSQTDLEPLNNNELYAELGLSSGDLQEWKEPQHGRADGEWDSFMHVLVGGS